MTRSTMDQHATLEREAVILRHLADTADQLLAGLPSMSEDAADAYAVLQAAAVQAETAVALG